jgi:hypothetical protein
MNLRMVVEDAVTPAPIRDANAVVYVTLSRKAAGPQPQRCYRTGQDASRDRSQPADNGCQGE